MASLPHTRSFTVKVIPRRSGGRLHAAALPGRVLPHRVVHKVVVQEGEVVVERYGPAAGLGGRVPGREPPAVSQAGQDLVVVGLGLPARPRAVPEYHLLAGAVAQAQVRNVEVDLFEDAAPSSPARPPCPDLPLELPLPATVPSALAALPARSLLPLPPSPAPSARVVGGRGGGDGRGGAPESADGHSDEVHHVFQPAGQRHLHGV